MDNNSKTLQPLRWHEEKRRVKDLLPHHKNPRKWRDKGREELDSSLFKFDQVAPSVINADGTLIDGHRRLEQMLAAGWGEREVDVRVPNRQLSPEEVAELMVRMNTHQGTWDFEGLQDDFFKGFDFEGMGLELEKVDGFEPEKVAEAVEDDGPGPVPNAGVTVRGDVWELVSVEKGLRHRVMCGDSTSVDDVEKLMEGEKANLCFTSPPYNANATFGFNGDFTKKGHGQGLYKNNSTDDKTSEDYIQFNAYIFSSIKTIAANDLVILYNINYNRNSPSEYIDVVNKGRELFPLVETIVWEKSMAISLAGDNLTRIFEFIFVFYNGVDKPKINKSHRNECIKNLWKISNVGANHQEHKACFPVRLVAQGIELYSKEGSIVFEPFTGSGTTLIACEQLSRHCRGMELDERYCDVIVRRWVAWMEKEGLAYEVLLNGAACPQERLDKIMQR